MKVLTFVVKVVQPARIAFFVAFHGASGLVRQPAMLSFFFLILLGRKEAVRTLRGVFFSVGLLKGRFLGAKNGDGVAHVVNHRSGRRVFAWFRIESILLSYRG